MKNFVFAFVFSIHRPTNHLMWGGGRGGEPWIVRTNHHENKPGIFQC